MKKYAAIICLLSFLISLRTIGLGLSFDDYPHLQDAFLNKNNPALLFAETTWPGNLYRPLFSASLLIHGKDAMLGHSVNILLYVLCCLSVFFLLAHLFDKKTAFVSTLFFTVLPIHSEVIASIAFRTELLSFFFVLASLVSFLKLSGLKKYLLAFSLLLLGMLSKENSVVALPLLLLCLFFLKAPLQDYIRATACFSAAIGVYLIARMQVIGSIFGAESLIPYLDNPLVELSFVERFFPSLALLGKYFVTCLLPLELSIDYSHARLTSYYGSSFGVEAWASLIVFLVLLDVAVMGARSAWGFSMLWFFAAFSITANLLFPIGTIFSERLAFLPSVGFSILLAHSILTVSKGRVQQVLVSLIVLVYGLACMCHLEKWQDDVSLLAHEMNLSTKSARSLAGQGVLYLKAGKPSEAEPYFKEALEIYPSYPKAYWGLGQVAEKLGKRNEALAHYERSLEINNRFPDTLRALGKLYLKEADYKKAGEYYTRAMNVNNYDLESLAALIKISEALGLEEQAKRLEETYREYAN